MKNNTAQNVHTPPPAAPERRDNVQRPHSRLRVPCGHQCPADAATHSATASPNAKSPAINPPRNYSILKPVKAKHLPEAYKEHFWDIDRIEALFHDEQPDAPLRARLRRTYIFYVDNVQHVAAARTRYRRLRRRETLDGLIVYEGDEEDGGEFLSPAAFDTSVRPFTYVLGDLPPDPVDVLHEEFLNPRYNKTLPAPDGRGIVEQAGNAVRIAIKVENDLIVDIGFRAFGNPIVTACASFMSDCAVGKSTDWAACTQSNALAYCLRLAPEDRPYARMVTAAMRGAVKDYRKHAIKPPDNNLLPGGAPRGRRKINAITLPAPTPNDIELLLPGETYEELMRERAEILGTIQHLDECLHIGEATHLFRQDVHSSLREELMAFAAHIEVTIPALPLADQRLIHLVAMCGFTERDAAEKLGVSQPTVHRHLWAIAYRIQKKWRQGESNPHPFDRYK